MKKLTIILLVTLLPAMTLAQESSQKVLIPMIVTDRHKEIVNALKSDSLKVTEKKVPIKDFELVRGRELPLELGLLIDTSSSERDSGHWTEIVAAARELALEVTGKPDDRVFFITFSERADATGWLAHDQINSERLDLARGGGTALFDSVAVACRKRMGPRDWTHPTRRLLLVVSDGDDNQSHVTRNQAISEALVSGVVILTINSQDPNTRGPGGERTLGFLSSATGGESYSGLTAQGIPKAFRRVKEIADGMYYLKYAPPASGNRVHEVEVKPSPKENLEISYPQKYSWVQ